MDFFEFLTMFLFFAIPAAAIAFFVASLIALVKAKKANKRVPGAFTDLQIKKRKILLAVSSFIMVIFITIVTAYIALIFWAIAFM